MEAAKSGMTKKVKRLELGLKDFKELDEMDIPDKSLHSVASEVEESRKAVKEVYTKMEEINEVLERKLILVDRAGGVPDVEKSLEELSTALQEFWEKWETVMLENKETFMNVNSALKEEQKVTLASSGSGTLSDSFIRFNPAKPSFLKEKVACWKSSGFLSRQRITLTRGAKPTPAKGCYIHPLTLFKPTWVQSQESKGMSEMSLPEKMKLIKSET